MILKALITRYEKIVDSYYGNMHKKAHQSPDVTASSVVKLTQMIKQNHVLKQGKTEPNLKQDCTLVELLLENRWAPKMGSGQIGSCKYFQKSQINWLDSMCSKQMKF